MPLERQASPGAALGLLVALAVSLGGPAFSQETNALVVAPLGSPCGATPGGEVEPCTAGWGDFDAVNQISANVSGVPYSVDNASGPRVFGWHNLPDDQISTGSVGVTSASVGGTYRALVVAARYDPENGPPPYVMSPTQGSPSGFEIIYIEQLGGVCVSWLVDPTDFQVTIESLQGGVARGSFSGRVLSGGQAPRLITGGSFTMRYECGSGGGGSMSGRESLVRIDGTSASEASGRVIVRGSSDSTRRQKLVIDARHVDTTVSLSVFIGDPTRGGELTKLEVDFQARSGTHARWTWNTKLGDVLPFGVSTVGELVGMPILIRFDVIGPSVVEVLRGTIPMLGESKKAKSRRVDMTLGPGAPQGGEAKGSLVLRIKPSKDQLKLKAHKLDLATTNYHVAVGTLENPGVAVDLVGQDRAGELEPKSKRSSRGAFERSTAAGDQLPGAASLDDLAGWRVEVRDEAAGVWLSSTVPSLGESAKRVAVLNPGLAATDSNPKGKLTVSLSNQGEAFVLNAQRLDFNAHTYSIWLGADAGSMNESGPLRWLGKARLIYDWTTHHGDAPPHGADLADLAAAGVVVEIHADDDHAVHLVGQLSTP